MRRALSTCLSLPFALLALAAAPDEGQWLPQQVRTMDWAKLRARGLQLSKDEFWHPERGGVLSAAVQLGGCSAAFVSPDGLVLTNHHCGFGALRRLSSLEHNYLRDGFAAASRARELPALGMEVYVLRRIRDVTERVHAAQRAAGTDRERWLATARVARELVAEGEKEPHTSCRFAEFLEGKEYHLYYRTRIRDVRLVYAPPRAVGEFGGEVDNWEWPRHTGDFCFFRAYVAPDGTPRPYHPENVPYRPTHWLRVAPEGVEEGDLVLILGYPGRTERYVTSVAASFRERQTYPLRHRLYTDILAVLERAGANDPRMALRLSSLIKSLANVQKNAAGMIEGFRRNRIVESKQREERALAAWIAATPERRERFGGVLEEMCDLERAENAQGAKEMVLGLLLSERLAPVVASLANAVGGLRAARGEASEAVLARVRSERITRDLDRLQRPLLAVLLDAARRLPPEQRLRGTETFVAGGPGVPPERLVENLLGSTAMLDAKARVALFEQGLAAVEASEDPVVVLARRLDAERSALNARAEELAGRRLVVARRWIAAQEAWRGHAFYPDANGTLRVSIATVKGYVPRDGLRALAHTTVAGILEKETGKEPFASPAALRDAALTRHESRFFDRRLGDVPVCFLADGDTTGGNSGSPVVNGRGELVGINFDRVFENVAGDYGWRPERSRNISVDVRYVLWFVEHVQPARGLLAELLGEDGDAADEGK